MVASSVVLTTSHSTVTVIAAQVVLALLVVAISTVLTRELHDVVPSSIRAGVSSGVGTMSWMAFVPFALGFGLLSRHVGVLAAGWLLVAVAVAAGVSLLRLAHGHEGVMSVADAVADTGRARTGASLVGLAASEC